MSDVINISVYKFTPLSELLPLRDHLRRLTAQVNLRGTILLSPEGINLFVAGSRAAVDAS